MFKKSILTAAVISLASISSFTNASTKDDFDLNIVPATSGAWIKVTSDGQPVSGASVSASTVMDNYVTNDNGQVFVLVRSNAPHTVTFTATDNEGHSANTKRFITGDRR